MSDLWKKVQGEMVDEKTLTKKAQTVFWFPVKYIKIPDIFYKILKFLVLSWASIIAHKNLLDLIIWMQTAPSIGTDEMKVTNILSITKTWRMAVNTFVRNFIPWTTGSKYQLEKWHSV